MFCWLSHILNLAICITLSMHVKSFQLCPTLCDPMDCSLPGSHVHWILQARILEWVAMLSFRGPSWPRVWTLVSFVFSIVQRVLYLYEFLNFGYLVHLYLINYQYICIHINHLNICFIAFLSLSTFFQYLLLASFVLINIFIINYLAPPLISFTCY